MGSKKIFVGAGRHNIQINLKSGSGSDRTARSFDSASSAPWRAFDVLVSYCRTCSIRPCITVSSSLRKSLNISMRDMCRGSSSTPLSGLRDLSL